MQPRDTRPKLSDLDVTKTDSSRWQRMAALPKEQQEGLIEPAKKSAVDAVKSSPEIKAARRAEREAELAARQMALPERRYGVIYADPPWQFEPYSRETGMDQAADNHYPTMALADIKVVPLPAADDAVLFLWRSARCCRRPSR